MQPATTSIQSAKSTVSSWRSSPSATDSLGRRADRRVRSPHRQANGDGAIRLPYGFYRGLSEMTSGASPQSLRGDCANGKRDNLKMWWLARAQVWGVRATQCEILPTHTRHLCLRCYFRPHPLVVQHRAHDSWTRPPHAEAVAKTNIPYPILGHGGPSRGRWTL